jgi:hypothetical protein
MLTASHLQTCGTQRPAPPAAGLNGGVRSIQFWTDLILSCHSMSLVLVQDISSDWMGWLWGPLTLVTMQPSTTATIKSQTCSLTTLSHKETNLLVNNARFLLFYRKFIDDAFDIPWASPNGYANFVNAMNDFGTPSAWLEWEATPPGLPQSPYPTRLCRHDFNYLFPEANESIPIPPSHVSATLKHTIWPNLRQPPPLPLAQYQMLHV